MDRAGPLRARAEEPGRTVTVSHGQRAQTRRSANPQVAALQRHRLPKLTAQGRSGLGLRA